MRRSAVHFARNGSCSTGLESVTDEVPEVYMRKVLFVTLSVAIGAGVRAFAAVYDLPNNDNDCPANCRQIPWRAGSDLWNGGTLPTYAGVTCTGLTEGSGTTDNTARLNSCLTSLSSQQASVIPPGIYHVN